MRTAQDALRKIRLLRGVKPERGASAAEAETAERLARLLIERYAIAAEEAEPERLQPSPLTWAYWEALLREFHIDLQTFGQRGHAMLGQDRIVHIKLHTGQWWIGQKARDGLEEAVARDQGVEALRAYLVKNVARVRNARRHRAR